MMWRSGDCDEDVAAPGRPRLRSAATGSLVGTVDEELADLLIFVCAIANRLDINLADALRRKETLNETRAWA
jgi:NTP pyrophosphatase (non-canonical NTP hydrolase)